MGSSGSARSGPEGLLLRVKLASPKVGAPRPRRKGESRGRGAEGERGVRTGSLPPSRGSREDEGGGSTPLCSRTLHVQRRRLCIAVPVRDAYPSGCDGSRTRSSLVCKTLACRLSAHTLRFFSGWGIIDPGADGRPLLAWRQRFSGCTPRGHLLALRAVIS